MAFYRREGRADRGRRTASLHRRRCRRGGGRASPSPPAPPAARSRGHRRPSLPFARGRFGSGGGFRRTFWTGTPADGPAQLMGFGSGSVDGPGPAASAPISTGTESCIRAPILAGEHLFSKRAPLLEIWHHFLGHRFLHPGTDSRRWAPAFRTGTGFGDRAPFLGAQIPSVGHQGHHFLGH